MFKMLAEGLRLSVMNFLIYRLLRFLLGYRERHGRTLPLLASAPMVYLGAISYAMYMYQLTVLHLLDQRYGSIAADHTAGIVGRALLALSVLLAACTVSRYGMELPVQRLRRYIVRPSQAVRNPETGS
jgi:peptidoglycan/LPS O-acetylase OafA/YrhL